MSAHSSRSPSCSRGSCNSTAATASAVVSPTSKRKRTSITDPSDHWNADEAGHALSGKSSKKAKYTEDQFPQHAQSSHQALHRRHQDMHTASNGSGTIVAGRSSNGMGSKASVDSHTPSPPSSSPSPRSITVRDSSAKRRQDELDILRKECAFKSERVDSLLKISGELQIMYEVAQRSKQDMMLQLITDREANAQQIQALRKEKYYVQKAADEMENRLNIEQTKLTQADVKLNRLATENKALIESELHLHCVISTLDGDLKEFRNLESEELARRKKQLDGLPPAYKDYRKRSNRPPYEQHEDRGTFNHDILASEIRAEFDKYLRTLDSVRRKYRQSENLATRDKGDAVIFCGTIEFLASACQRLRNALLSKEDEAAWILELILDLSWTAVSACEVRPVTIYLTGSEKTTASLHSKEADECLLEVLKKRFDLATNDSELATKDSGVEAKGALLVYKYQRYLTQVSALQRTYLSLGCRTGYEHFKETIEWLEGQVQCERTFLASVDSCG